MSGLDCCDRGNGALTSPLCARSKLFTSFTVRTFTRIGRRWKDLELTIAPGFLGTGSTGPQSWSVGPYNDYLPTMGAGYDICWVSLPDFSTQDVQRSGEYVAYGVQFLAPKSATGKVSIIGHSQGEPSSVFGE